jgi:hypothetical protein
MKQKQDLSHYNLSMGDVFRPDELSVLTRTIFDLCSRWKHESKHENFDDYRAAVQELLDRFKIGATVSKMTKRPFQVEIDASGYCFYVKATPRGKVSYGPVIVKKEIDCEQK